MNFKNLSGLFLLASVFISCTKKHSDDITTKFDPNVYISGYANLSQAVYWNNGKQIDLGHAFNTTDIALSGSDIYVLGNIGFALPGGGGANAAVYWKNGKMIKLGNDPSYANSMAISGTDIYICGYATINDQYVAAYWKNGVIQSLGNIPYSSANSIKVDGADIYIVGTAGSYGTTAVYWKNGVLIPLEQGVASGMDISGSDIYISGTTSAGAVYWKNGVKSILYNPADTIVIRTSTTGIVVSGQDVHVIGYINRINAVYWKNGILTQLNNPFVAMNSSENKNKILLKDTSVYISLNTAHYWKDGNIIYVGNGYGSSIAVKQ
jgi:hypothetical protein